MRVSDLFHSERKSVVLTDYQIRVLRSNCSEFLEQSQEQPLLKNLKQTTPFSKVKVRFHNKDSQYIQIFNAAFFESHKIHNLHQRAIFACTAECFVPLEQTTPVYVFPKNGFKFLYNKEVTNSNVSYKATFEQLSDAVSTQVAPDILKQLLQYTYCDSSLLEAIKLKTEIILYNIPFYYAVRVKDFHSYDSVLNTIE